VFANDGITQINEGVHFECPCIKLFFIPQNPNFTYLNKKCALF